MPDGTSNMGPEQGNIKNFGEKNSGLRKKTDPKSPLGWMHKMPDVSAADVGGDSDYAKYLETAGITDIDSLGALEKVQARALYEQSRGIDKKIRPGRNGKLRTEKTIKGEVLIEMPKDELQLASAVREYAMQLIISGRTEYQSLTTEDYIRTYLEVVERQNEDFEPLVEKLADEVGTVQRMIDLGQYFSTEAGIADGVKNVAKLVAGGRLDVSVYRLRKFSNWVDEKVPDYLVNAYGGRDRVSMSEMVDRSLTVYAGFLGEWADAAGVIWREEMKNADKEVREKALHRGSPQEWGRYVKDKYKKRREKFEKAKLGSGETGLYAIENKYTKMLGLPVDQDGAIKAEFLSQALAEPLAKYREKMTGTEEQKRDADFKPNKDFQDLEWKLKRKENIRLHELFLKKNIFDDKTTKDEKEWTKAVVAALCGGGEDYASYIAISMVEGMGEASQLNTTEEGGGFDSGAWTHVIQFDARQITEAITGAPVGAKETVGRFRSLGKSLLRNTEIGGKNLVQLIRDGKRWSQLNWGSIGGEPGTMWNILVNRSLPAMDAIMKAPSMDFEKDLNETALSGLVKSFNSAFAGFGGKELRFTGDDEIDLAAEQEMWSRRQRWAYKHLEGKKEHKVKNLESLGKDEWSPWYSFALGVVMSHAPSGRMLPVELWPSAGIVPNPKERKSAWSNTGEVIELGGVAGGRSIQEKSTNPNAIPTFIARLERARLLTPAEIDLLVATLREIKQDPYNESNHNVFDLKYPRRRA